MSVPKSEHKVYMYGNDFQTLCAEVFLHQRIETGGNLFGLWTTSGSAVIHVVLGPGKDCRRTDTSFHQDIEYMKRVGSFVNQKYMLCHIGEWHSHHCLSLSKPSRGDELTIERNFPEGMSKFLVIIANIKDRFQIVLSPYFFTHGGTRYEKAEYKVLESDSPFSSDVKIMAEIELGAEPKKETALVPIGNRAGTSSRNPENARIMQSSCHQNGNTNPAYLQADRTSRNSQVNPFTPESQANPRSPHSKANGNGEEPMDVTDDDLYPPRDYDGGGAASSLNAKSTPQATTPSGPADPDQDRNSDDKKASEQKVIMNKIHDELKKWFGNQPDSKFDFKDSKDCPGAIEIKFKHSERFWMLRFPEDFPTNPAKLFTSVWEENLHRSSSECSKSEIAEPLNNEVNVLVSIKNKCRSWCNICKKFSKESLSLSERTPRLMEKFQTSVKKVLDEIMRSIDVSDLKMQCPSYSEAEITFTHSSRYWIVDFPAQFPNIPARVYFLYSKSSSQRYDAVVCPNRSHGQLALSTSELIIKAIYLNCVCIKCNEEKRRLR